jgi:CheY-like chemotaxis protein
MAPGSGLGLSLCKQYVEMMGGDMWVVSTPGIGSTFSFSVPISEVSPDIAKNLLDQRSESPPNVRGNKFIDEWQELPVVSQDYRTRPTLMHRGPSPTNQLGNRRAEVVSCSPAQDLRQNHRHEHVYSSKSGSSPTLHALVVDDNPVNRRVLHTQLTMLGFSVEELTDGDEVIEYFAERLHQQYPSKTTASAAVASAAGTTTDAFKLPRPHLVPSATSLRTTSSSSFVPTSASSSSLSSFPSTQSANQQTPMPDVVFMDDAMVRVNGPDATRAIRDMERNIVDLRHHGNNSLKIVALTAADRSEAARVFFEAGADEFLTKPATLAQLRETLRHLTVLNANAAVEYHHQ